MSIGHISPSEKRTYTEPRTGMVSSCYPLDEFYKAREEYGALMSLKGEPKM